MIRKIVSDTGYGTLIWSALSSGLLTGKYNDGIPEGSRLSKNNANYILKGFQDGTRHREISGGWDEILKRVRKLQPIADDLGCSMAQLAIAWVLKNENTSTVILGATKRSQIEDNLAACSAWPSSMRVFLSKLTILWGINQWQ